MDTSSKIKSSINLLAARATPAGVDVVSTRLRLRRRETQGPEPEQQLGIDNEVEIRLTGFRHKENTQIRFDFKKGNFEPLFTEDLLIDLLDLPSRTVDRKVLEVQQQKLVEEEQRKQEGSEKAKEEGEDSEARTQEDTTNIEEMLDLYGDIMTREQLLKIDSQPNPFNYSGRCTQTHRIIRKEMGMQTDPAPDLTFSANAGFAAIYDAYEKDYVHVLARLREEEIKREKERERERKSGKTSGDENEPPPKFQKPVKPTSAVEKPTPIAVPVQPPADPNAKEEEDLSPALPSIMKLERMVNQNIFDDVTQDYKYWEDTSDEFRQLEGSLLPLWKFVCEGARSFVVTDICWSPFYHDLFIASYTSDSEEKSERKGMICMFTLKNPGIPERVFQSPSGILTVQFHPSKNSVIAAGREDGIVAVYDIRSPYSTRAITSSTVTGKHLLPVCQVEWMSTEPGENPRFYSVSQDGRISQWLVRSSSLLHEDILDFTDCEQNAKLSQGSAKPILEGTATCIAINPRDKCEFLIGVDTGVILQISTTCIYNITRYHAHISTVRTITWNHHHLRVFATCSIDWTMKLWLQNCFAPLVTMDLGSPAAGLSWSPYSSSVIAAASEEGRVFVYDFAQRMCQPLCSQNVTQRRRLGLSCVAFNPFSPILLVGGEKGYLVTHKLSPNLRKTSDAKQTEDQTPTDIEIFKMERIIAVCKEGD